MRVATQYVRDWDYAALVRYQKEDTLMKSINRQIIDYSDAIGMHFEVYTGYEVLCERHWHQGTEIVYVFDGTLKVCIGDKEEYTVQKEHFCVINSMEVHSTKCVGRTTVLLLQIPHTATPTSDRINCRNYRDPKYSETFRRLAKVYQDKCRGYYFEFNSIVYDMLYRLFVEFGESNVERATVSDEKEYVSKIIQVIEYVQKHYMEPISLDDVSHLACYNKQYFTRIFKKYMKTTFLEYLNEVRIRHIFEELIYTDSPISEIAERNGFTNNKNFQKVFRKSYGCTPSEMRRKYRASSKGSSNS